MTPMSCLVQLLSFALAPDIIFYQNIFAQTLNNFYFSHVGMQQKKITVVRGKITLSFIAAIIEKYRSIFFRCQVKVC